MTSGRAADGSKGWVAILAAWLAVLQLAIGGLSPLRAAAATFDPLQILCTQEEGAARPGLPTPARHDDGHDCCLAGCLMGAALPATPPSVQVPFQRVVAAIATAPPSRPDRDRRPAASPRRTRGPPDPA